MKLPWPIWLFIILKLLPVFVMGAIMLAVFGNIFHGFLARSLEIWMSGP